MFFDDKKKILYLKRSSLELLDESGKAQAKCQFPNSVVHNLEVENMQQFESLINQLAAPVKKAKTEVILVLAEELIFYKSYPSNTPQGASLTQKFLNTIPFESTTLFNINYLTKDWLTYLAVSNNVIENLKNSFQKIGWTIKTVVPGFLFGNINTDGSLSKEILQQINQNDKQVKKYNFLNS